MIFSNTNKYKFFAWALFCLFVFCATVCLNTKTLTYFQKDIPTLDTLPTPFRISPGPGDILYIQVNSLGPIDSTIHNPFSPIPADPQAPPSATTTGYLIDKNGILSLSLVGNLSTTGKTSEQIEDSIQARLQIFLKMPTALVRLANLRITVLGEVNKPSTFILNYNTLTLPQALGLAGDLTAYARRDNVLVIRQIGRADGGRRTYTRLDLTKSNILNSPYYYLQPNDVIYVAPNNARAASIDRTYQVLPIVLSGISVIATILSILLK